MRVFFLLLLNKSVAVLSPDRLGTQEAGQNQMRSLKEEWLGTWEGPRGRGPGMLEGYSSVDGTTSG